MPFNYPRRHFIGGIGSVFTTIVASKWAPQSAFAQTPQSPLYAYVGSFTSTERDGQGDGINVYRVDPASKDWTHIQNVNLVNPSFLALDKTHRFLYSAHADLNYATAFSIDATSGRLRLLNRQETGGMNGVHLAVDQSNRFLVVSNYASGSMALLPIIDDGSLGPLSDLVELQGSPGPGQTSSHPHHNPFDPQGRFLLVPDKGFDTIFVFQIDVDKGALVPAEMPSVASATCQLPSNFAIRLRDQ